MSNDKGSEPTDPSELPTFGRVMGRLVTEAILSRILVS